MSSGVIPNDDCKPAFDKVRLGKVKYVTYKIDDKAEKTEVCAKEKMLYASSKQSLRNALSGVHLDHQAADMDDVTEEIFTLKALGK